MDDNISAVILFFLVLWLAFLGVIFIFSDNRSFDSIVRDCQERQYIQNKTIRITCNVNK